MSFETEAQLSIEIPQSELRNARQQIESEIGTTEIGMTDGGTMSAQAAGGSGSGRERRRRRREYRWARERTDYLEEITGILYDLEDEVGGGGGGMLGELLGGVGGGAAGLLSGALGPALGSAVGSAVGPAISDALSEEDLGFESENLQIDVGGENLENVGVDIQTEDLETFDVGVDTEELENLALDVKTEELEEMAIDVKTEELEQLALAVDTEKIEEMEVPITAEQIEDFQLGVEDVEPLPVEEIDPIEISVDVTTHATGAPTGRPSGGESGYEGTIGEGLRNQVIEPIFGEGVAELDRKATDFLRDAVPGMSAPDRSSSSGSGTGSITDPMQAARNVTSQTSVSATVDPQPVDITVDAPVNVDVNDLDRLEDNVVSAVEDQISDVRDDLEDRIDDLERQIQRG